MDETFATSEISNTALVSDSTETVVYFNPSTYRLTLEMSPVLNPVPTAVTRKVFDAGSNAGVKAVKEATGATKLKVQSFAGQVALDEAANVTERGLFCAISLEVKPVDLILQVSWVVVAVKISQSKFVDAFAVIETAWSSKVVEKFVPVIVSRVPPKTEPCFGLIPVTVDEV